VHRYAEEQVERQAPTIIEDRLARVGVERGDTAIGHEHDVTFGERREDGFGGCRRRRDRRAEWDHDLDRDIVARAARPQELVQQERRLARRRRALERRSTHADDRRARGERRKQVANGLGARHRIELVAAGDESRGRVDVVIGPQRDDQDVGLVPVEIRHHLPPGGIDRGDGFLTEPDVRLREVAVVQPNGIGRLLAEHHVELREAEHERVGPIDQRDVDLIAELLRQPGRQFQPAETGSEDEHRCRHGHKDRRSSAAR
jgi:hypothetical protein